MFRPARLALWLALSLSVGARAEAPFSFEKTPGLLPKNVVPRHYAIRLEPKVESATFRGSESIAIETRSPVRELTLHANGLAIAAAKLDGTSVSPQLDEARQIVTFRLERELPPGAHRLDLEFSGKIGEQPYGLFLARYQDGAKQKNALATQMEATDARRLFPCWDEPAFRASFELSVVVPAAHTAISNMPAVAENPLGDGLKEVRFAKTPSMPTYLFALFIGELESLEDEVEGVKLRVFTTPGKRDQARYALEITKQLLPFYNEYFGTAYPLPKLDQVAFPSTGAGGMENWGAILYSDTAFLYDPATSSQSTRERVFEIVAHEIAHQWFGNLVTMAWWDNLWLNEGFASWMGTKATDHFNPGWQSWLRASSDKEWAMALDARSTTHPIQQPVKTDAEATDAFDEITYNKGQAFIRMLESYLGEQPFRDGIRAYLQRHAYSNTTTADLWKALEEVSGKPVSTLASGWTEQPGFPVVTLRERKREGAMHVEVTQERFTLNQKDPAPLAWATPIAVGPAAAPLTARMLLLKGEALPPIPIDAGTALKANIGDVGYYRVAYDDALFARLRKAVPMMAAADRLNLLNDTWAMAQAGRMPVARALELIDALAKETNYAIASRIIDVCWFIHALERGTFGEEAFHTWARRLLRPHLERLGWEKREGESALDASLRSSVISTLGAFGDADVAAEARRRFASSARGGTSLPGDLRATILTLVGRGADEAMWKQLHALGRAESSTELKRHYYRALASAQQPDLIAQTLAISLADELPTEDAAYLVRQVGSDGEQPERALSFALANLPALLAKVGALGANSYVPALFRSFSDEARAAELEALAREKLPAAAGYQVAKAADDIRFKAALKSRLIPDIDTWCRAQPGK